MSALVRRFVLPLLAAGALASAGDQANQGSPPPSPAGPDLEEFVPTEKVPADRAVAFPVDI